MSIRFILSLLWPVVLVPALSTHAASFSLSKLQPTVEVEAPQAFEAPDSVSATFSTFSAAWDVAPRQPQLPGPTLDRVARRGAAAVLVELAAELPPAVPGTPEWEERKAVIAEVRAPFVARFAKRAQHLRTYENFAWVALSGDAELLYDVAADPAVARVTADVPQKLFLDDSIAQIEVPELRDDYDVWGIGPSVAVLDTGVDDSHEFLTGRVVAEACFSTSSAMLSSNSVCPGGVGSSTASGSGLPCSHDRCDHGTHVAGIVAGLHDDMSGVAPAAGIVAIQVFSELTDEDDCSPEKAPCVRAWTSDAVAGLDRVLTLNTSFPIASVNMSFGSGRFGPCTAGAYDQAAADLDAAGVAVVAAAGNDRSDEVNGQTVVFSGIASPACVANVISVGAVDDADDVADFSQWEASLDLLAPGVDIRSSTEARDCYHEKSGTSMAAPHVAGAFALLRELHSRATPGLLLSRLRSTGLGIADPDFGGITPRIRLLQAARALDTLAPLPPTNLRVGDVTGTTIELIWDDNARRESEFRISGTIANGYSAIRGATVAANTSADRTTRGVADRLDPGRGYDLEVRACDARGRCSPPATITAQTINTLPAAPTGFGVTNTTSSTIDLAWNAHPDAITAWRIGYWGGTRNVSFMLPPSQTGFSAQNLDPWTVYSFNLRACNSDGCSNSVYASARTPRVMALPQAPANLRVVGSTASTITLAWDDLSSNESEFRFDTGLAVQPPAGGGGGGPGMPPGGFVDPSVTWGTTSLAADQTQHTVSVTSGRIYHFRVQACNAGGCSAFSNELTEFP